MCAELVSVIIPTFNGSLYLLETVESALRQTYSPVEVIVVDDGSTEDIASVLQPVRSSIHYVRVQNGGPAAARNHGLRLSTGKYIAFLDHDDVWDDWKIAAQADLLRDNPRCGLVYSFHKLIDGAGNHIETREPDNPPSGSVLLQFALKNRITTFSATLFRRSVFDDIGFLNESRTVMTADDYDIYLRVAEKYEVLYVTGRPISYRLHAGNLAKNYSLNYSATVAVLEDCLGRNRTGPDPKFFEELKSAVTANLKRETARYAYCLYYAGDRGNAGKLFRKAFLLDPRKLNYLGRHILCRLPEDIVRLLKTLKKRHLSCS